MVFFFFNSKKEEEMHYFLITTLHYLCFNGLVMCILNSKRQIVECDYQLMGVKINYLR